MAHETEHTTHHPSFNQYVLIAIILFAITIVEFLLIWDKAVIVDYLGPSKIPLLVFLSAIKFAIVIMFYMHLKFDNRLLGSIFIAGLVLAFIVGIAVISTFVGFEGEQRSFAAQNAVPYVEHEEAEETTAPGEKETTETTETKAPPAATGPVAIAVSAKGDELTFDTDSITVDSGANITITFTNPSTFNQHNLVIVQAGTKDAVATDGITQADNDFVPPGDPRVIANTNLLAAGASGEVTFTAPAAGAYQFVCTFPGHNFTMFGDFTIN